jgi:hypothetical protein
MDYGKQPQRAANITTVLDLCDRDEQDDILFPIDAQESLFYRDHTPYINHVNSFIEHTQRGPAEFGQRFTFDIGRKHGDFLSGAFLQVKLGHWLSPTAIEALSNDPLGCPWRYANYLGNILIAKAELEINGVIIETIDSDYIYIKTLLDSTSNQFGLTYDGYGKNPFANTPSTTAYPTNNGTLICPLLFHFMSDQRKALLALIASTEGTIKINIQFRPFTECISLINAYRENCTSTPLMSEFIIGQQTYKTPVKEPRFEDVRLLLQGVYYDSQLRDVYMRRPFEYIIRQPFIFTFTEPMKYVANKTALDRVTIQLPLEINNPIEEIIWVFRRKSAAINNEWNNYSGFSALQEKQLLQVNPAAKLPQPINNAIIQINGVELINADGDYFRNKIASVHAGGYNAYSNFIYGYNFAREPAKHQPSGSFNASRSNSVRLTLDVSIPRPIYASSMEAPGWDEEALRGWEIKVIIVGLNWLRFENGISNLLFKD